MGQIFLVIWGLFLTAHLTDDVEDTWDIFVLSHTRLGTRVWIIIIFIREMPLPWTGKYLYIRPRLMHEWVVVGLEEVVVCRWRIKLADATQLIDSAWVQEFNSDRVNK